MREALVSIFGQDGAVVAQYLITFFVILALAAVAVWVGRRFAGGAVNVAGRGRLPRLAVIDALTVDKRRRLVLVRRDNVEHLLLIGGPSDIVVEPSITRTRVAQRPGQTPGRLAAQPGANAPQPAPPPPPPSLQGTAARAALRARAAIRATGRTAPAGAEEPIPFPPRQSQSRQPERNQLREDPKMVAPPAPPPTAPQPTTLAQPRPAPESRRIASPPGAREMPTPPDAKRNELPALPVASPFPSDLMPLTMEEPNTAPVEVQPEPRKSAFAPPASAGHAMTGRPPVESLAAAEEPRRPPPGEPDREESDDADRVGNLEKDMARLLGQISTARQS